MFQLFGVQHILIATLTVPIQTALLASFEKQDFRSDTGHVVGSQTHLIVLWGLCLVLRIVGGFVLQSEVQGLNLNEAAPSL